MTEPGLEDLLGSEGSSLLRALGDRLFPADDGEPTVEQSGAYLYVARRLAADPRLLLAYRAGATAVVDAIGAGPADAAVDAWLSKRLGDDNDLPTGLSGAPSPEAISAGMGDPRMFEIMFWQHLREGMFGDPRHGGNTDAVMWRWLGYNGPQLHGYTESELLENARPVRPMMVATNWEGVRV